MEKACQVKCPVVKCMYCLLEYQQTSKKRFNKCKECEVKVKKFGKPRKCKYCGLILAFVGNRCLRCISSENKYGSPVSCQECKKKCAFDSKEEEGGVLCWLCSESYKRAEEIKNKKTQEESNPIIPPHLSCKHRNDKEKKKKTKKYKTKRQNRTEKPSRTSSSQYSTYDAPQDVPTSSKSSNRPENPSLPSAAEYGTGTATKDTPPAKVARVTRNLIDPLAEITLLREEMTCLEKEISLKDDLLVERNNIITELKARHLVAKVELRIKMRKMQKDYDTNLEVLLLKVKSLEKKVATLSRSHKL